MSRTLPRPWKKWGQNFIVDPPIREKIIRTFQPEPTDFVVEVGPGTAALTKLIIPKVAGLHAVELDPRMAEYLDTLGAEHPAFSWEQADFLAWQPANIPAPFRLFGNLPYYISSPLILKTFELRRYLVDAHFLLQKEMARRLAAEVGTKAYGILTVFAKLFGEVRYLFDISHHVFYPKPGVDSGFVRISFPERRNLTGALETTLRQVVRTAFQQRRKTLENSIKSILPREFKLSEVLNPKLRADAIAPQQYLELAKAILAHKQSG